MPDRKRLTINLVANFVSTLTNFGVAFVISAYIIRACGAEAYGFVGLANNFTIYSGLALIAFNSMSARFVSIKYHQADYDGANKYFRTVSTINALYCLILLVPAAFFVLRIDLFLKVPSRLVFDVQLLFCLIFGSFLISTATSALNIAPFVRNRTDLTSYKAIISSSIRLVTLAIMYYFWHPYVFYMGLSLFIVTLLELILNLAYFLRLTDKLRIQFLKMDRQCVRELFNAGVWNTLSSIGWIGTRGLDLLIANVYLGPQAMGVLAVAKNVPNVMITLVTSTGAIFSPRFALFYAKDDKTNLIEEVEKSVRVLGVVNGTLLGSMFILVRPFFKLWAPSVDSTLLQQLAILTAFDYIVAGCVEGMHGLLIVQNKVKIRSLVYLGMGLLNTAIVWAFVANVRHSTVSLMVITGVSSLLGIVVAGVFLPRYAAICLGKKPMAFYPLIARSMISLAAVCLESYWLSLIIHTDSWFRLILVSLLSSVFGMITCMWIMFDRNTFGTIIRQGLGFITAKLNLGRSSGTQR